VVSPPVSVEGWVAAVCLHEHAVEALVAALVVESAEAAHSSASSASPPAPGCIPQQDTADREAEHKPVGPVGVDDGVDEDNFLRSRNIRAHSLTRESRKEALTSKPSISIS